MVRWLPGEGDGRTAGEVLDVVAGARQGRRRDVEEPETAPQDRQVQERAR